MELYGSKNWDSSNMFLEVWYEPDQHDVVTGKFLERLRTFLKTPEARLLREERIPGPTFGFQDNLSLKLEDLLFPRQGVYFDLHLAGRIQVIWNHMQMDGVGLWRTVRTLFDENPPLLPFKESHKAPPRIIPEIIGLPSLVRRMAWRGKLRKEAPGSEKPVRQVFRWDAQEIRSQREALGRPAFNILSSAMCVRQVFDWYPARSRMNVGLTAYFPFLRSRNKYAVILCKVRNRPLGEICKALTEQTKNKGRAWGQVALQTGALNRVPEKIFDRVTSYYRRQVDVLISSLPVGRNAISIGDVPVQVVCFPQELTIPYYFLMVGTRKFLDVSVTSSLVQPLDQTEPSEKAE